MPSDLEIEVDPDLIERHFQFSDPFSGQMVDMHVSYDHIFNMTCAPETAMLFRPRLSIHDVRDMVTRPEGIQLFQWRDRQACVTATRRKNMAEAGVRAGRGWVWMQLRGRRLPRPAIR